MWIELGIEKPGPFPAKKERMWFNTDHIVRVEFTEENNVLVATVTSVKPGGSDRTILRAEDAERMRVALNKMKEATLLPFEEELLPKKKVKTTSNTGAN